MMRIGSTQVKDLPTKIVGAFVDREGERFYRIENYQAMPDFFMSIVSGADHWLFISSNGALSAGRKNPELALFPYYTDDKIQDSPEITGSKTIVRVQRGNEKWLWEPFSDRYLGMYAIQRNLYKSELGNKLIFEEINKDLDLRFSYGWYSSEQFGLVRKASLVNEASGACQVELLDGIQNVLPWGVTQAMQNRVSTLVDAYKKNELDATSGLGMFTLSSIIVDKAEPSEALKCNTVWSAGLDEPTHLLCSRQLATFRAGGAVTEELDVRAERGAYLVASNLSLAANAQRDWIIVAEVNQGPSEVAVLRRALEQSDQLSKEVENDIEQGTQNLARLLAMADGMQLSGDQAMSSRHLSNVLFNIMRGGVFVDHYQIDKTDLINFIDSRNNAVAATWAEYLDKLPASIHYLELIQAVSLQGKAASLLRLLYEYLPLTFSRRHGDPSRPWNKFSIELKAEDGSQSLYYAGNWRDIFQNWEALAYSYPAYVEGMIAKFANASTADGYNPYRITRDGIDWETIEPDDPWSYIGYWGDHQIIYLQKLLEVSLRHHPEQLPKMLTQPVYSYANVPYRIKEYEELLKNPFDTVDFDDDLEAYIETQVERLGTDGKLLHDKEGGVYQVSLTEKLLVSVLAKFSNFIPEAGIWLNTQRPEWNDANNALVGNGVSMVTLYYMRRFQHFCRKLFAELGQSSFAISQEVVVLFDAITSALNEHLGLLSGSFSNQQRRQLVDQLGQAGSQYRQTVYQGGFSTEKSTIQLSDLLSFFETSLQYIDHSIRANRRRDGLYHAYNLMTVEKDGGVAINYLYEMLEGQVAVLSSGYLSPTESLEVLKALRASALFREDQYSYILYPDRKLTRFTDKNNLPPESVQQLSLVTALLAAGDHRLVEQDATGVFHFNGTINNAKDVEAILEELAQNGYAAEVNSDGQPILDLFEELFDHKSFTGRSGTFFAYEGLGSIYWHMVSKLLLAAQEVGQAAIEADESPAVIQALIDAYYDVRHGIGFNKSPDHYGAFPSDPYSHTPAHAGAQQPGMTGQVKEDILARFGELGVEVSQGEIRFRPNFLKKDEFLAEEAEFHYFDLNGNRNSLSLTAGSLAFTYCQVPVCYQLAKEPQISIHFHGGQVKTVAGLNLGQQISNQIFQRSGEIEKLVVNLSPGL